MRAIDAILCGACWRRLPEGTRARLLQGDGQRRARYFQLLSALRRGVVLERIEVTA